MRTPASESWSSHLSMIDASTIIELPRDREAFKWINETSFYEHLCPSKPS